MKIVEIGGAQELLSVLVYAKDELTVKEALEALNALSKSGKKTINLVQFSSN